MSSPIQVAVVADVDPAFVRAVSSDARFEVTATVPGNRDELIGATSAAQVIVSRAYVNLDAGVIEASKRLELILQGTSGFDNIDVEATDRRGVRVITTPTNANAVAELTIANILALTRTIPSYDRSVREGRWERSDCADRHELAHYTLGIVGIGRVGTRVAMLARAFEQRIFAYDPYVGAAAVNERGATKIETLEELLSSCDILSLHVPLTTETRAMIGEREIRQLRRGAFLINTSRGEVLDTEAALGALASGAIGGLALDVHDPEPPNRSWPDDPRLILTPHVAGCTAEAKLNAGNRMYEELCRFYGYEPLETSRPSR